MFFTRAGTIQLLSVHYQYRNQPIQTEYYVCKLIRRFVSLLIACVKSYHGRLKVEHDVTIHRQREVIRDFNGNTWRKHDTGFSIRPVAFVSLYCIQIIYRYIININRVIVLNRCRWWWHLQKTTTIQEPKIFVSHMTFKQLGKRLEHTVLSLILIMLN